MKIADLAPAPAVTRGPAVRRRPRRAAAAALAALGVAVLVAVLGSGLFGTLAGGQQMLDEFAPHLDRDALARYDTDLATLRAGAVAAAADEPLGERLAGVAAWVDSSSAIDQRAAGLLGRVRAAEPDYRAAAAVSGFDRVPLLLVALGAAALTAGIMLGRGTRGTAAVLAVLLGVGVAVYPSLGGLWDGAGRTERLLVAFEPIMDRAQVVALQRDFVVVVQAVGELDADRAMPAAGDRPAEVDALVAAWPGISSDLAGLVGTINDNLRRFDALDRLPDLALVPSGLLALGLGTAGLTLLALPRRRP